MVRIDSQWIFLIDISHSTIESKFSIHSEFISLSLIKQILGLAIFFACFCQKSVDNDDEAKEVLDEGQLDLENDEEYLHSLQVCLFTRIISHR
jgi:hypothetical protein